MLLDELAAYLTSKGVGVTSSTIFMGSRARIPPGDGPYLSLRETGGSGAIRIHNVAGAHVVRPTVHVTVRAKAYNLARLMAKEAHAALDGVYNTELSGVFYQSIIARQEPEDIGVDAEERVMLVFNLEIEKMPS